MILISKRKNIQLGPDLQKNQNKDIGRLIKQPTSQFQTNLCIGKNEKAKKNCKECMKSVKNIWLHSETKLF